MSDQRTASEDGVVGPSRLVERLLCSFGDSHKRCDVFGVCFDGQQDIINARILPFAVARKMFDGLSKRFYDVSVSR